MTGDKTAETLWRWKQDAKAEELRLKAERPPAPPRWLLDKLADEALAGGGARRQKVERGKATSARTRKKKPRR